MKGSSPVVELKLPVLPDMELSATKTAEIVAKHMELGEEKSAEISMALIEACINAFEHSETKEDIYIHFIISDDMLTIKVIDKGVGFDASSIELPNIDKTCYDADWKKDYYKALFPLNPNQIIPVLPSLKEIMRLDSSKI